LCAYNIVYIVYIETYSIKIRAIPIYIRPWKSTYRTRRWMSAEKSYQQGRSKRKSRTGWADWARKRYKPRPGSSWLSRNRKLDRDCQHLGRSRERQSWLIHVTDISPRRDRTPLSFALLISPPVPRNRLPFPVDITHSRPLGETPFDAERKNLRFLR